MRVIELFAGIGACSTALKRIGQDVQIVDAVEIDKYAMASFNAVHSTNFETQDIVFWDKDFKDIDLITHGSPCQDFSVAGKQAGGDLGSGTRSSLMYETIRIVGKIRPKYVLWENVKNILSKKHKHNFDAYIETMKNLGYTSYYQVLNAKDYGIPQNRERVYTISIRNDINKSFNFPDREILDLRLRDMLEENVEEKYYLKDAQVRKIENSNFIQEKNRIQEKACCDTLLARDWKDPKCVRVGGMYGQTTRWGLYDDKGIAPTLVAAMGEGGGYVPMVERIGGIFDTEDKKHQAGSVYDKDGLSPTLDAMQGGWRQPSITEEVKLPGAYGRDFGSKGKIEEDICSTLQAAMGNGGGNVPLINVIGNYSPSNHEASRIVDTNGLAPTVKENHGTVTAIVDENNKNAKHQQDLIQHENNICRCIPAGTHGSTPHLLKTVVNDIPLRIRKLTPKECWRLMGFSDNDFERAASVPMSNTQLYKQAGNSIVVNVLEKIFKNLL